MTRANWPMFGSLGLLNLVVLLAVAQPAWSVTLDTEGRSMEIRGWSQLCPAVKVIKAWKGTGADRDYHIEGPCSGAPGLISPFAIKARVGFKWWGQWGDAFEEIEVIGPGGGKVLTSVAKCDKNPFILPAWPVYKCTGEKSLNSDLNILIGWKRLPLFHSIVPENQAYTGTATQPLVASPPSPPVPGAVRIVSPGQNQAILLAQGPFEVKFEDNPTAKPDADGVVKLEWQRFVYGLWVSHPGPPTYVQYYKMTQLVSINPGKYRVRAMASPVMQWTPWREFSIIGVLDLDPSQLRKVIPPKP